jgi:DNA-directed RNA polymerase specialized sigma24 family protein
MSATVTVSPREASEILGRPLWTIRRLMRRRKLTVQRLPGTRPMLIRAEIEQLAKDCLVPAEQ